MSDVRAPVSDAAASALLRERGSAFLVKRDHLPEWSWRDAAPPADLADGQVVLRQLRFALTANNITYAKFGGDTQIQYWRFFPADDPWGQIPVWGIGEVARSRHPALAEGERVYGYFPMASHLVVAPDRVRTAGFIDAQPHRAVLPPTYNEYARLDHDRSYDPARADQHLVLRPLFSLSFFLAAYLQDEALFGARQIVISSASSKTAMGLAFLMARDKPDGVRLVGLTSKGNAAFVARAGHYDDVISYDAIAALPTDAKAVFIDIAGDPKVLAAVHRHLGDIIQQSIRVGATHWDSTAAEERLPGPAPQWFFTPDHIVRRRTEWGTDLLRTRLAQAWGAFVDDTDRWLRISHGAGRPAIEAAYSQVLAGGVPAQVAHTLSFAGAA
ncbi:MAG: DUF2855 family protein [Pseudomonadota bacterium]